MSSDHHHLHRPSRLSLPPRNPLTTTTAPPTSRPLTTTTSSSSAYHHPSFPFPFSSTPTPTPSKHRLSSSKSSKTSSLSFIFLLLFSLRSLYSLLPFIRSTPSAFSIFPFSFLVSLLSFLFTLFFNLFSSSDKIPFRHKHRHFLLSHVSIKKSQLKFLVAKSVLLAVVFLLRFQALKYCGTAALILAELSGNVAARFLAEKKNRAFGDTNRYKARSFRGFFALFFGLFLLSISWDRLKCFPLSSVNVHEFGFTIFPGGNCLRIWPMLLPFLSGFLGCYEKVSTNWGNLRDLGQKRIRFVTLFFTTILLFVPAVINMFVYEGEVDSVSITNYGWPLANTVIFGVLLSENYSDDKFATTSKDFKSEYLVTFLCTLVLELIYFSELSLWGLLICGLFLWIAIRELDPVSSYYPELGVETGELSLAGSVMKPIRHILSERKSRKIALFLLINTAYMFVEFAAGFLSNSLGLISDACHMLFDCAALAIGLYASYISRLPANSQFNYGRGRFEVLSGYVNAVLLVLVGVLIVLESLERILEPQEISTNSLLVVSVGGLLVNIVGLIFFHEEHHHSHGGGSCSHGNGKSDSRSHDHHEEHNVHGGHGHDHDHHTHGASSCSHAHDHHEHHNVHGGQDHDHDHHKHGASSCSHAHDHHEHNDHHEHHNVHEGHDHDHDHHTHGASGSCSHAHDHLEHHIHGNDADSPSHDHHLPHLHGPDHHSHSSCSDHDHVQHQQHSDPDRHISSKSLHVAENLHTHDAHHHHIDHNMEGIFLHVLADTLGSVGVVVATLLIKYRGWIISDPICSIFISILIVASVIPLLRNSAEILLQRVPRTLEQNLKTAINDISKTSGVRGIQNLHFWSLTNADVVGTLHLHLSAEADEAFAKARVSQLLYDAGIKDLTLQIERVKSS